MRYQYDGYALFTAKLRDGGDDLTATLGVEHGGVNLNTFLRLLPGGDYLQNPLFRGRPEDAVHVLLLHVGPLEVDGCPLEYIIVTVLTTFVVMGVSGWITQFVIQRNKVQKEFEEELKRKLWSGHLWNPSYFVATVSENMEEQIKIYSKSEKKVM